MSGSSMKRYNILRLLRTLAAVVCSVALALTFVDWGNGTPVVGGLQSVGVELARWQIIPALLGVSTLTLVLLLLLTLLFGRIYCSVLCPLGVVQDGINRVRIMRERGAARRFSFKRANPWLRYGVLAVTALSVACGVGVVVSLVDPYAIFGRAVHEGLRPIVQLLNNFLTLFFGDSLGSEPISVSWLSALMALLMMGVVAAVAWLAGRRYCSWFCPVGTLLGEVSRFALFMMEIDTSKCVDCGVCGKRCKAECIDTVNHTIDATRCVVCFDCVDACSQQAISFTMKGSKPKSKTSVDCSRRDFLAAMATLTTLPLAEAQQRKRRMQGAMQGGEAHPTRPVSPPGSVSLKNLQAKCSGCHLCISKCPSHVLQPAVMEYGLQGIMQPVMRYDKGYCLYDCNICGEVCPTGAILPMLLEQKRMTQIGHAIFRRGRCVVARDGVQCGNCAEHCPADAIKMMRGVDGRLYPSVEKALCIGCGACEHLCPAEPKAIEVVGYEQHIASV